VQQRQGRGLFTTRGVFLLIVNGDRLRRAVLMLRQGEQADVIADHLPVEGQSLWERPGLCLEPAVEQRGERLGIHAREHL
jgi:hypothetical protein